MKKICLILVLVFAFQNIGFTQVKDSLSLKTENLLNEISSNACKCIDSIEVFNKSQKLIAEEVGACIDKQTTAYQMGVKMLELTSNLIQNIDKNTTKSNVTIDIASDEKSNEYKKYYFELERNLVENCTAIKDKAAAENRRQINSVSDNEKALEYYKKGQIEEDKKEYAKAISYYKKAVNIDEDFAFAWDNIGVCNRYLGNFDEAIKAYEKSISINPYGLLPLQNLAIVYSYKKEYDKAISTYERLARIDDQNPEVYYGIGQVSYQYTKEYEKSLQNMCKAYSLYVEQKSPYRTDAEKIISLLYTEFKKLGKEARFYEILKENNLNPKD
jgi:tetratricopeptide (TPR) repeat protein